MYGWLSVLIYLIDMTSDIWNADNGIQVPTNVPIGELAMYRIQYEMGLDND